MRLSILGRLFKWFSSPRLTLFLLVYATVLVFIGTLAQKEIGIMQAQKIYFESFFCMAEVGFLKFPMIGGATVGVLSLINIMLSGIRFTRYGVGGFGVAITHMGLALLIVSGGLQYFARVEGRMTLITGEPNNVVVLNSVEKKNDGTAADLAEIKLPFSVRLKSFKEEKWAGSDIPKSFSSEVFFERDKTRSSALIEMNSPASFGAWTFYQMSFSDGGRVSIISAVKNHARLLPWIAVGAVLFGMLIIFTPRVMGKSWRKKNEI